MFPFVLMEICLNVPVLALINDTLTIVDFIASNGGMLFVDYVDKRAGKGLWLYLGETEETLSEGNLSLGRVVYIGLRHLSCYRKARCLSDTHTHTHTHTQSFKKSCFISVCKGSCIYANEASCLWIFCGKTFFFFYLSCFHSTDCCYIK